MEGALPEDINNSRRTANELRKVLDHLRITTVQFSETVGFRSRHGKRLMSGRYDGKMPKVVDYVLWAYSLNCPRTLMETWTCLSRFRVDEGSTISRIASQRETRAISVGISSDSLLRLHDHGPESQHAGW
jgi:hypothetical protein